jgi:hypothetical protein
VVSQWLRSLRESPANASVNQQCRRRCLSGRL